MICFKRVAVPSFSEQHAENVKTKELLLARRQDSRAGFLLDGIAMFGKRKGSLWEALDVLFLWQLFL